MLLYADDIVMFGENKEEMQEMLNAVNEYDKLFDVKISEEKSKIVVINGNKQDHLFN